jgi:FHA domain
MSDNEKTRVISNTGDAKTRLVRPVPLDSQNSIDGRIRLPNGNQPLVPDVPKTRLAGRPTKGPESQLNADDEPLGPIAGWLVVVKGKGQGRFAPIYDGMNSVGRGEDQSTRVDFGDESISRKEHAFVTYDLKLRKFYLNHGGKSNIIRCNGAPVLQPVELTSGDMVSIGETEFCFTAFCGPNFDWSDVK